MSASREKRKRFEERSDGQEKRQVRARETVKAQKRKKLITGIVAIVVVVLLIVGLVFNSTLFYTGMSALKVGSRGYTASDFNYEYFSAYYNTYTNIANTYGDYASLLLDPSQPLSKQQYSDDMTWADYFEDAALNQLQQLTILTDMADAEGWNMTPEQKAETDSTINSMRTTATSRNYTDFTAYLRTLYGKGITEKRLRSLLDESYRATYYSQYLTENWRNSFTEEDKIAYYDTVRNDYDLITYMSYDVDASVPEDSAMDSNAAREKARSTADEIATARDQASFADVVYLFAPEENKSAYEDPNACLHRLTRPDYISGSEARSWLTDQARVPGDTKVLDNGTSYTVLLYLDRNGNEYKLANFRCIIVPVEKDEDSDQVTDITRYEARQKVDKIMTEYNTDPTEDKFAELADQYDTTGQTLFENAPMGSLSVPEVEEFLYDENTQAGDVETFYANEKYYIVYPLEPGEQYNLSIAEGLMVSEKYNSTIEEARDRYPLKKLLAFRFTK